MTDLIQMLDDQNEPLRIVYYGDPGSRKTTYAMAAANLGRIVVLDADHGLKARALRRHGIDTSNIEVHTEMTYTSIQAKLFQVATRLADGEQIFALVIDTATVMLPYLLDPIAAKAIQRQRAKGLDTSDFEISLDARGELSEAFRKINRQILDLGIHVILVCHVRRDIDQATSTVRVGPAMPPGLQADLIGLYDYVLHCRTEEFPGLEEDEGSALTRKRSIYVAKDRYYALPPTFVDPTFERLLGYTNGEIVRETDPVQLAAVARRKPPEGGDPGVQTLTPTAPDAAVPETEPEDAG